MWIFPYRVLSLFQQFTPAHLTGRSPEGAVGEGLRRGWVGSLKKIMRSKKLLFALFMVVGLAIVPIFHNQVMACKPGEVYDEGTLFLGICWGRNGNDCAKCIPVR